MMERRIMKVCETNRIPRRGRLDGVLVMSLMLWGLLALLSSAAIAQTGFSGLRGNITDQSGAVVPGAQVVLIQPATGDKVRTGISDREGNFEFPNLIPGPYRVSSEMTGFKAFVANDVVLDAGQIRRLDIRLDLG